MRRVAHDILPSVKNPPIRVPGVADTIRLDFIREIEEIALEPLPELLRSRYEGTLSERQRMFLLNAVAEFKQLEFADLPSDTQRELETDSALIYTRIC